MIWAMAALIVILMALVAWGDVKLMVGFVALVAVLGGGLLAYDHWSEQRAGERIALNEVEMHDFEMQRLAGAVYELTGRVHNHAAQYSLTELSLRVLAQDCTPEQAGECVTIGEATSRLALDVPPDQARDIKEKVIFREGRPQAQGELRWRFDVLAAEGG